MTALPKLRTLRMPDVGHASLAPMRLLSTRFAQGTLVQDRPASLKKIRMQQCGRNKENFVYPVYLFRAGFITPQIKFEIFW